MNLDKSEKNILLIKPVFQSSLKKITSYKNLQGLIVDMKRGRRPYSAIRKNIVEILYYLGKGYGYDIYKTYIGIFPKVSRRSIYYHLTKGVELGIFKVDKIEQEQGSYSWGGTAEKVYYRLGEMAQPKGISKVKDYIEDGG